MSWRNVNVVVTGIALVALVLMAAVAGFNGEYDRANFNLLFAIFILFAHTAGEGT